MIYRLGQVIFPMTSALAAQGESMELKAIYLRATRYLVYLTLPYVSCYAHLAANCYIIGQDPCSGRKRR